MTTTRFSSPVPVGSRLTSGYSPARFLFGFIQPHAGTDWAPPLPGQYVPIFAAADGTVIGAGIGILAGHSGKIVILAHGLLTDSSGSDLTTTNYGHLSSITVYRGQKVKAGDVIGYMGATGNVSGVHLHMGVRFGGKYADPAKWLKGKGITPGVTPPVSLEIEPVGSVKPITKPSPKPTQVTKGHTASTTSIQKALKTMGYDIVVDGDMGPKTVALIKEYQRSQRPPYTLLVDGVWGNKTKAHYIWTKQLQKATNGWKSSTRDLRVDGHYGYNTVAKIRDLQKRNKGKAYKGIVDGIPGRVFCKMLKIPTHP